VQLASRPPARADHAPTIHCGLPSHVHWEPLMARKVIQRQTWFIALGESTRHDCLGPPAPLRVETLLRHVGMSRRPIAVTCRQLISKCPQLEKICCNSIQNSGFSIQSSRETLQDFRFPIQLQTSFTEEAKSQREPGGLDRAGRWRRRIPRLFRVTPFP